MFEHASLADLPAFHIGHAHDGEALTGCTAIVAPQGAICSADVRGGGPATRETDLLRPENMIERVHAVVLSGGSAFGIEASCGVMEELARHGIGFEIAGLHVPIVVGACLFDLAIGKPIWPDKNMGMRACANALTGASDAPLEGNVGAGCGATVGKFADPTLCMKSGFGVKVLRHGQLVVGAAVAVNAIGCVRDAKGSWIAGVRDVATGAVADPCELFSAMPEPQGKAAETPPSNTTLGCILTNAALTKAQCAKISSVTHDAYARAIKPVHLQSDGDAVFCMASGEVEAMQDMVSVMAAEAMQQAIVSAVCAAQAAGGVPAACDLAK